MLRIEKKPMGYKSFLPQKVVWRDVWIGGFRKGIILDDDLHGERCNLLLVWMNECNILLNCNIWFRVVEIKTAQVLL